MSPGGPTAAPLVVRPSLLAALDVLAKAAATLLFVFLPVLLGAVIHGRPEPLLAAVAALAGLESLNLAYGVAVAFVPMLQLAFTRYTVDEEGVHVRVQLLSRRENVVRWEKVTLLRHRRTIIDRVFGIERLDVVAYGARGTTVHLVGLRDGAALRDLAARRMRQASSVDALMRSD